MRKAMSIIIGLAVASYFFWCAWTYQQGVKTPLEISSIGMHDIYNLGNHTMELRITFDMYWNMPTTDPWVLSEWPSADEPFPVSASVGMMYINDDHPYEQTTDIPNYGYVTTRYGEIYKDMAQENYEFTVYVDFDYSKIDCEEENCAVATVVLELYPVGDFHTSIGGVDMRVVPSNSSAVKDQVWGHFNGQLGDPDMVVFTEFDKYTPLKAKDETIFMKANKYEDWQDSDDNGFPDMTDLYFHFFNPLVSGTDSGIYNVQTVNVQETLQFSLNDLWTTVLATSGTLLGLWSILFSNTLPKSVYKYGETKKQLEKTLDVSGGAEQEIDVSGGDDEEIDVEMSYGKRVPEF